MKQYGCYLAVAVLLFSLFAGCRGTHGQSGALDMQELGIASDHAADPQDSEDASTEKAEAAQPLLDPAPEAARGLNAALSIIPGAEVLEDFEGGLFLLKEYGVDMGWSEANRLEHLERGTPYDEVGQSDIYFLLVPKHTGSRVEVSRLGLANDGVLHPTESIYYNAHTPDSYGLVLTSREPEGMPELSVTVEYGGVSHTHSFLYDGRGERPTIQLFGGDSSRQEDAEGPSMYRWTSEGRELAAQIPASWGEGPHFLYDAEVDGQMIRYQVTFYPLQAGQLEGALTPESGDELHRLQLVDGRDCLYVLERDSPQKYLYALEVDGMLQLVQAYCILPDSPAPTLYPPTEADDRFLSVLESIQRTD